MSKAIQLGPAAPEALIRARSTGLWLFSWPLLMGLLTYVHFLFAGDKLLRDGDTYWHVATGRWIFEHGSIPTHDPFSHSMPGAVWTAHEWLSELMLFAAHELGGWTAVVGVSALAFAATIAVLTRTLLHTLEPIYAILFAALAVVMAGGHVLARPHVLAMPLLMVWTIGLLRASEERRSPSWWLLPVITVWANMHGGFTLGIALAFAFALEALLAARQEHRLAVTARKWGLFLGVAIASVLITPHGLQGIAYTWEIFFEHSYALERIGEWRSPDFHTPQPLELWLLGGLALVLHQGLRLPPVRLILLLVLLHLSLKHVRSIELVGLLGPLLVAAPFGAQWRERARGQRQLQVADQFFVRLARPASRGAVLIAALLLVAVPVWIAQARPLQPPEALAPVQALRAMEQANLKGPVLNSYSAGGYLIFSDIPVFIDGRADMYREDLLRQYGEAMELRTSSSLDKLLERYQITWTLLDVETPAIALLDHLPQWRRVYSDKFVVVHARIAQ